MDGFFARGWLSQGFTGNPANPNNRFNGPVTFNDRSNEYQMNQLYLTLGREVETQCHAWDIGGRVDLLYGTDYYYTTAIGLETRQDGSPHWNGGDGPRDTGAAMYGLAMPQLYAEVVAPIGNGLNVKMGHFYTIMGYESVMAPDNFFYSHAYAMQYGEPLTHTGLLADYRCSPCLSLRAGFTRGWDTWEDPNETLGFIGGVTWTSVDQRTCLAFTLHTGNEDIAGDNDRTAYSIVLAHQVTCRLRYVLQHDFGIEANAELGRDGQRNDAKWYGINQYLYLSVNDATSLGLRLEWFRDQDNARVLAIPIESLVGGGDYFAATFGANWEPYDSVVLRPEVRWDRSDVDPPGAAQGMFNDFSRGSQFTFGLDLIVLF